MAIVQGVAGLTQGAEQIPRDKDNAEQQNAFVKPATQASDQRGGAKLLNGRVRPIFNLNHAARHDR